MSHTMKSVLDDLREGFEALLAEAREQGRQEVLDHIKRFGGGEPARPKKASAGKAKAPAKARAAKKPRKNPWASMTPEQREERVRKMLAGRGLEPKGAAKGKAKSKAKAKPKQKRKNPWASMTPEQKAARVKKMLAARGLKPKK